MDRAEIGRRRLRIFAFVIAGAFVMIGLAAWWTGRENLREGSIVVSQVAAPMRVTHVPTTYRAVYRLEDRAGKAETVTTERVWVRRPFESRVETWSGPPPGDRRLTLRQSGFGVLASISERSRPLNIAVPPSLASGDLRIDAVLSKALRDHTIIVREQREVYGRRCQIYRTGGPVLAGDLPAFDPDRDEYADVCVDRNGLVLEEVWVNNDKLIRRRVAVHVTIDPPIDRRVFEINVPPDTSPSLRGSVQRIDAEPPPGLWHLSETPQGFERTGVFGVVIPPAALPNGGEAAAGPSSTSEVFVRGPDMLVIDQDPSLAGLVGSDTRAANKVRLPDLRNGELIIDGRMSEVRGEAADGNVVRIFGTLSPSELLKLARSLTQS